jgi:serine/threonine-protein kinase HipA
MMDELIVYVYADWLGLGQPQPMGVLIIQSLRGSSVMSFEYDRHWLKRKEYAQLVLDPDLSFFQGTQYAGKEGTYFGLFFDSGPDMWGRLLMDRREAILAREQNRSVRPLQPIQYLLGVDDTTRMGALRYKLDPTGPFIAELIDYSTPPITSLSLLEEACRMLEIGARLTPTQEHLWLQQLVVPGSSLGGARPKANVLSETQELWIAKFPSQSDEWDKGAWEMLVYELAFKVGVNMSPSRLIKLNATHRTFLTRRFDRLKSKRIHYASAMTLLGYSQKANQGSYLDLAQFLIQHGAAPTKDLRQLWLRIVFTMAVSNTDDHMRNHGFLLEDAGWRLSPAFDINPDASKDYLSLNVNETKNRIDFQLALEAADYFRVKAEEAKEQIASVKKVISTWQAHADELEIPKAEQDKLAMAFRYS